ncbi:MAG TPA: hypothetical protein VGI81_05450 [Tepidisphaeraceae bacterium]|jgi:hypothetical protein
MKRFGVAIVIGIGAVFCARAALFFLVTGRLYPPTTREFVALAQKHQYVVQAACDYRAERGMWPEDFSDLVPDYLPAVPPYPVEAISNGILEIHADAPHTGIRYAFRDDTDGWWSGGDFGVGRLPMPKVAPTRPAVTGGAQVSARLAEYDRRIARKRPGGENAYFVLSNYTRKIAYLVSLGRAADALAVTRAAGRAMPEWWRPPMVMAVMAPPSASSQAEAEFRAWVDAHPTFIHYWYLSRYYRDRGRDKQAVAALRKAVTFSLADTDPDGGWVPDAHAFDAAAYACQQRQPELVLQITSLWEKPRGVYTYHNDNLHAFRAAAELALGRFGEAKVDLDRVVVAGKTQGLWAGNLDQLGRAVAAKDQTFVYQPGKVISDWTLLPPATE